jgi:hypothetical protein
VLSFALNGKSVRRCFRPTASMCVSFVDNGREDTSLLFRSWTTTYARVKCFNGVCLAESTRCGCFNGNRDRQPCTYFDKHLIFIYYGGWAPGACKVVRAAGFKRNDHFLTISSEFSVTYERRKPIYVRKFGTVPGTVLYYVTIDWGLTWTRRGT